MECESIGVVVSERGDGSSFGAPPYYVVAYELDGMVSVNEIGSDASNLKWFVKHRAGAFLVSSRLADILIQ